MPQLSHLTAAAPIVALWVAAEVGVGLVSGGGRRRDRQTRRPPIIAPATTIIAMRGK